LTGDLNENKHYPELFYSVFIKFWNYSSMSFTNIIFNKSCESMQDIPDASVHLTVTSPPYRVGKEYEDSNWALPDYLNFIRSVFSEVKRVTVDGGRVIINIANTGRNPYIPLTTYYTNIMEQLGFLHRGVIVWDKGASAGKKTSWGSWLSAANPTLRDINEFILCFSKGAMSRAEEGVSDLTRDEFLCYTESLWRIGSESATRIGHPAPYPVELPYRAIKLYSFKNDIVLDPFMGSGSTAIAALKAGRQYVGYELSSDYIQIAQKRIQEFHDNNFDMYGDGYE
jgi:site-specific DNA-methyltransferase (adenine-specific)